MLAAVADAACSVCSRACQVQTHGTIIEKCRMLNAITLYRCTQLNPKFYLYQPQGRMNAPVRVGLLHRIQDICGPGTGHQETILQINDGVQLEELGQSHNRTAV